MMFESKKYKKLLDQVDQQKALIVEAEMKITEQNQLYRTLYEMLSTGMPLGRDSKVKDYVREGYEGNPDVFSIVVKLSNMFAEVVSHVKVMQTVNGKEVEVDNEEINALFEKTNYYQNFYEFARHWAVSNYITGEAITYTPKYTSGANRGKITRDGLIIMPSQNVDIIGGGWRKPIGKYKLDIADVYTGGIEPADVWHERFAPTLNFENGANFRGTSPIKVAANIINSQNKGYEVTAKMYAYGHPPGILSKEDPDAMESSAEQESKFRERYKTKYQGVDNMAIPIFTLGKLNYTKIGYDNLQELQVISMSEHGRRVFCNLLQVPSQLFNDSSGTTFNNMGEAAKAIYTNRIIPDVGQFCTGFNTLLRAYDNIWIKPDYSGIDALQEDKAKRVLWVSQLFKDGIITGDEYLVMLGEEPTGLPEMQIRYMDANRLPANFDTSVTNNNKFYEALGILDKL